VGDAKPDLSRLGELAAGLGLHQHLCFIYETQEEQFAAALPFLRSGLERGENVSSSRTTTVELPS
jgi:hypothetical protein